jgi:hypothetical protein
MPAIVETPNLGVSTVETYHDRDCNCGLAFAFVKTRCIASLRHPGFIKDVGQHSAGVSIDRLSQRLDGNPRAKHTYRNGSTGIREQKPHIATARRKSESKNYISQYRDGNPRAKHTYRNIATGIREQNTLNVLARRESGSK